MDDEQRDVDDRTAQAGQPDQPDQDHQHDEPSGPVGQARDPAVRAAMTAMVASMVEAAGSNRRLQDESGVSEATIRNFRGGRFPHSSTVKAQQLDTWAVGAVPGHPGPGDEGSLTEMLGRWQGRPVRGPIDPTDEEVAPTVARRRRPGPVVLLGAVVVALLVAVGVLVSRLLDDGSETSGVASVRVDRDLPLDDDNFCSWVLGTHPVPLVSADPLVMRVDVRCSDPAEPDPVLDTGTAVYAAPTNDDPDAKVGVIRTGNSFVPRCWTVSDDVVADGSTPPNSSPVWLRAEQPDGWLPVVNVGGGYTEEQLTGLGLERC